MSQPTMRATITPTMSPTAAATPRATLLTLPTVSIGTLTARQDVDVDDVTLSDAVVKLSVVISTSIANHLSAVAKNSFQN